MTPRRLEQHPCRQRCAWTATGGHLGGLAVFTCCSCASEWTADQGWTPCDADGTVPPSVQEAVARRHPTGGR